MKIGDKVKIYNELYEFHAFGTVKFISELFIEVRTSFGNVYNFHPVSWRQVHGTLTVEKAE